MVIGIAGTNGSGKDTVMHMLANKYGFYEASASVMLETELSRRGLAFERENKRNLGNEWRKEYGLGAVVDRAIEAANGMSNIVVGSLRNSGEVAKVHELNGIVVWIDSDIRIRYKRITTNQRGRVEDKKTFEQFRAEEEIEMQPTGDATTLNMAKVKEMADIYIDNNSDSLEEFIAMAEEALEDVLRSIAD